DTGGLRAMNLRAKHEKRGCHHHRYGGQTAAADAKSVDSREPVAEPPPGETADRHRKKWKHCVARACSEIETTNLGHIEKEPTEENPCDIAEAEITDHERREGATMKYRSPGDDDWSSYDRLAIDGRHRARRRGGEAEAHRA